MKHRLAAYSHHALGPDTLGIVISGDWRLGRPVPRAGPLLALLRPPVRRLYVTADELYRWDSTLLVFLHRLRAEAGAQGIEVTCDDMPEGIGRLLDLAEAVPGREESSDGRPGFLVRLGLASQAAGQRGLHVLVFTGEIFLGLVSLLRGRAVFRPRDFFYEMQDCGAAALPIVSLIAMLTGIILAFVGAVQLAVFGAQVFVADLVGIAMLMEMGPMMTAVILAGRSGAAYAARIGAMQVNEEVDALRTMGISPVEFLVLPRILALVLMLPLLCVYADIMGIAGGALISVLTLDMGLGEYLLRTQEALTPFHFYQGLVKSAVFGVLVAFSGCLRGMQCGRSASAVGEAATSAVVTAIVLIVMADAVMSILFNLMEAAR